MDPTKDSLKTRSWISVPLYRLMESRLPSSLRNGFSPCVMNLDGSEVRQVTDEERDDYPTWHPDGKRLAIVSERKGKFDLYMVKVPSSGKITTKR